MNESTCKALVRRRMDELQSNIEQKRELIYQASDHTEFSNERKLKSLERIANRLELLGDIFDVVWTYGKNDYLEKSLCIIRIDFANI